MNEWNPKANKIFAEAASIEDTETRLHFLDRHCGGDEELRRQVDSLVEAHQQAPEFLDVPVVERNVPVTEFRPGEMDELVVGPYRILQKIGEGGFGAVYLAEQKQPVRRKVALKIIKPGMDTREVIARFEAERQALAMMNHPNIAKVIDGGTTKLGRPFFVMELIKGVPITEFCDENRLSTKERLELFTTVCKAVQHAHQKGVIHRDLKPSNVMVTLSDGEPMPKVIDFGVAKAINQELTDKTLFTAYGQMVGTPQYMSPEQAKVSEIDVDTRSDVYSLGVLLYELLTGSTPLDPTRLRSSGYDEIRRLIREEDAPKPSARLSTLGQTLSVVADKRGSEVAELQRSVRGELDWIVMKALDKDRRRRYEMAVGLAEDVQRHLRGDAVQAVAPTLAYRFRKMLGRNKLYASTAAILATTLVVATVFSVWQARIARTAQRSSEADRFEAITQRERALKSANANQRLARESRQQLYAYDMSRAHRLLGVGDITAAHELLEKHQQPDIELGDLRGFEWKYLWQKSLSHELKSFPAKGSEVVSSPDGRLFAYNLQDKVMIRQQAPPWDIVKQLDIKWISGLSFSKDGRFLAAAVDPGKAPERGEGVTVFDTTSWSVEKEWSIGTFPMKFSHDGKWLVFQRDGRLQLVQTENWQVVNEFDMGHFGLTWWESRDQLEFSRDGELLVFMSPGQPGGERNWQFLRLAEQRVDDEKSKMIPAGMAISLSPNGHLATTGGVDQSRTTIYDIVTHRKVATLEHQSSVSRIEYSSDGKHLVTAEGAVISVWDTDGYSHVKSLSGSDGGIQGLSVTTDNQYVLNATISSERTVKVWPLDFQKSMAPTEVGYPIGFTQVGDLITVDEDGDVRSFRGEESESLFHIDHRWKYYFDQAVHVTSDDRLLVGKEDGTVEVWDIRERKILDNASIAVGAPVTAVTSNPANPELTVVSTNQGDISIWNIHQQKRLSVLKTHLVHAMYFDNSGHRLGFLCNGRVVVYDFFPEGLRERFVVQSSARSMNISHDGMYLAVAGREGLRLFEMESGTLRAHRNAFAKSMAFSADSKTLVTAGGSSPQLWQVPTCIEMFSVEGPPNPRILFDPKDSDRLILGSRDNRSPRQLDLRNVD